MTARTVPSKAAERLLERLGRGQVEVVGRLVEQQQGGAGQLEQQDLEAGLLAARQRLERLARRAPCELVAAQRRHGRPAVEVALRRARRAACGRPAARGGRGSGRSSPGTTRAPSRHALRGRPRSPASSRRKWLLPVPLGPSDRDPLAEPDLGVERVGEPVQREPLASMSARLPVRPPPRRIVDRLVLRRAPGRPRRSSKCAQPASRPPAAWAAKASAIAARRFISCTMPRSRLRSSLRSGGAPRRAGRAGRPGPRGRWRTTRRGSTRPSASTVTTLRGGGGQQLAVVADEQDGLRARPAAAPRATACRRRRGSCRARRAAARRRRSGAAPRGRAASARRPRASRAGRSAHVVEADAERERGAGVPQHLGVVAARRRPSR